MGNVSYYVNYDLNYDTLKETIAEAAKKYGFTYSIRTPYSKSYSSVDNSYKNGFKCLPSIKNVYFNPPATVVLWDDDTKTIVKCQKGDVYSKETGLALCITKKALGNKSNFNDIFKKWIPEEKGPKKTKVRAVSKSCCNCKFEDQTFNTRCRDCYPLTFANWEPKD